MADILTVTESDSVGTIVVQEDDVTIEVTEKAVSIVEVGIQGPPGPPGTSGDAHYEQTFTNQSSVTVTHNLGKYPAVTVMDSAHDEVVGNVAYTSTNELTVTFGSSFSGVVLCN